MLISIRWVDVRYWGWLARGTDFGRPLSPRQLLSIFHGTRDFSVEFVSLCFQVGGEVKLEEAIEAAKLVGVNLIATIKGDESTSAYRCGGHVQHRGALEVFMVDVCGSLSHRPTLGCLVLRHTQDVLSEEESLWN